MTSDLIKPMPICTICILSIIHTWPFLSSALFFFYTIELELFELSEPIIWAEIFTDLLIIQ